MTHAELIKMKKAHEEQRRLEEYQLRRTLPRPKTRKAHIVIFTVLLAVLITAAAIASSFIDGTPPRCVLLTVSIAVILEFYLRFLGVKLVECYQHYADEERRRRCLCIPSCSEYAILCLKRYELIFALIKIRKRLFVTCRGDEYKIDPPYKKD